MSAHNKSVVQDSAQSSMKPVILIVDDSRVMRMALKKMLRANFDLLEATDGEDGWNKLQQNPSITAVFCDLSMPVLDGFGLMSRVRASDLEWLSEIPFIVITGNEEDDGVREQAMESGATDFITKPFRSSEIMERASKYVLHVTEESSEDQKLTEQETGSPQAPKQPSENEAISSAAMAPVTTESSETDTLHEQAAAESDKAESEARRFAERETARMHEHLLARQQTEAENEAKAAAEKLANDEDERKMEKERAIRKALLEQQAQVQDNSEIAGHAAAAEPATPQGDSLHETKVENEHDSTRFESWKQEPASAADIALGKIKRDSSLQAELNEALEKALHQTEQQDSGTGVAQQSQDQSFTLEELPGFNEMPTLDEIPTLEEPAAPDQPGIVEPPSVAPPSSIELEPQNTTKRTHEFPGMHKQDSISIHASHIEQNHEDSVLQVDKQDYGFVEQTTASTVDTVKPEVAERQRIQETAKIKERLEKLKEVEVVEELGEYSFLAGLFVRLYLPFLKAAHKLLGLGNKYEIKIMQQRLKK
jgi:CheY-like chemotaxis protein